MKNKTIVGLIAIIAIVVVAVFTGCIETPSLPTPTPTPSPTSSPTPGEKAPLIWTPQEGEYLSFGRGNKTKMVLVGSHFRYGVLPPEIVSIGCPVPYQPSTARPTFNPGDACVIINGTIRNEYDKDYFICLSARIYNLKGRRVGYMKCPFDVIHVRRGDTEPFKLHIRHDRQDIVRYDLFVNGISEYPPP